MMGGVRHRGLRRRWRRSDSLVVMGCIFRSRMAGWAGHPSFGYDACCVVVCFWLFRSAFRVGDPVIPFLFLCWRAASFF